ncbi:hypothetical protein B0H14DRAFT_2270143, partial [Mycena olivaceomarginata]
WPIPPDVSVERCAAWAAGDVPSSARASFQLPLDSDALFLVSRSNLESQVDGFWTGDVTHMQSAEVSDQVQVAIIAHVWREEQLDHIKACLLKREE